MALTQEEFESLPEEMQELVDPDLMDLPDEYYEPVKIGPTWQKDDDGNWLLPEHTLGWEIAGWCSKWLRNGDEPWQFTLEQLRFLLWLYAVDERGKFIYRKAVLQRLKGWGKDPLAAVICLVEFVGPSRFSHWGPDGEPVAKAVPNSMVQIAAVNQEQTQNTASLFASLMSDALIAEYDIKPGVELTYARRGTCRLKTVTSSPRALEGNRVTFAILNEVQHFLLGNKGHAMYEVIYQNAAKMDGRWLAITNAYKPGEESIGERLRLEYEDGLQGRLVTAQRFLYDSLEANARLPIHPLFLRRAAEAVRGDSVWLNLDTIVESIMDTSIPVSRSIRMWLNRIVATEDQLFEEADYERVRLETGRIHPGETVVLGFDGGKTDDSTAIVALRVEDHTAQLIRLWERPEGPAGKGWKIDTEAVDAAVREAMETYNVIGFYADLHPWESYIDAWNRDFGEDLIVKSSAKNAIAWDMRGSLKRSTAANEALVDAFHEGSIRIVHSANMRAHILNAHRRENNFGVSFGKESRESPRKVDAYAALMLAHECLRDYFAGKKPEEERTGMGWFL